MKPGFLSAPDALTRFLLLSGERCPGALHASAVRRDDWTMRLAVALSPALHPTLRADLAANDRNLLVRFVARERASSARISAEPIPAELMILRRMPAEQRRRVARLRRDLGWEPRSTGRSPAAASQQAKPMHSEPPFKFEAGSRPARALEEAMSDPTISRILLNGICGSRRGSLISRRSSLFAKVPSTRLHWIATEVCLWRNRQRRARPKDQRSL
ncbi:MAG: hypothetical protein ACO3IB_14590 [Phycisphaerales bacterium]